MCNKLWLLLVLAIVAVTVSGQNYGRSRNSRVIRRRPRQHVCPSDTYGRCGLNLGCPRGTTCRGAGSYGCCYQDQQPGQGQCPYAPQQFRCGRQRSTCSNDYECHQPGTRCCSNGCVYTCTYTNQQGGGY